MDKSGEYTLAFEGLVKKLQDISRKVKISKPHKYLSQVIKNYLEFLCNGLEKSKVPIPELVISRLTPRAEELDSLIKSLKDANFFKFYGSYSAHSETLAKIANILNENSKDLKPFLEKDKLSVVDFSPKVCSALDAAVKSCTENIEKIKQEAHPPSEFKKNLETIQDELTYIFWFESLARESFIDIPLFIANLKRVWAILGKNPLRIHKDNVLADVDEDKTCAIEALRVSEFFGFGVTHPTAVIYELEQDVLQGEEPDHEKTLLVRQKKKPKKQEEDENATFVVKKKPGKKPLIHKPTDKNEKFDEKKAKSPEEEVKDEINEEDYGTVKNKIFKKHREKGSPEEEEPIVFNEDKNRVDYPQGNDATSEDLKENRNPLILRVLATDEKTKTFLRQNDIITINAATFQLNNYPPQKLMSKYITKFGRCATEEQLQSDIKFVEPDAASISRKQFQILGNEIEEDRFIYKIICTAPPPKNDTGFKVSDLPLPVRLDSIIYISDSEAAQVVDYYDGKMDNIHRFKVDKNEEAEEKKEAEDELNEYGEEMSQVTKQRKNIKNNEKRKNKKKLLYDRPYLVLRGLVKRSELHSNELHIVSGVNPDGFTLGEDYKFLDDQNNCEVKFIFDEDQGWLIQGHSTKDKRFKIFQTKLSLWNYNHIYTNIKSDAFRLQPGMVIQVCGFNFKVEKV